METDGILKVVTNMTEMETIGVLFSTALGGVAAGFCAGEVSGEGVAEEREGAGVKIVAVDSLEGTLPEQSLVSHLLQRFQSESGYRLPMCGESARRALPTTAIAVDPIMAVDSDARIHQCGYSSEEPKRSQAPSDAHKPRELALRKDSILSRHRIKVDRMERSGHDRLSRRTPQHAALVLGIPLQLRSRTRIEALLATSVRGPDSDPRPKQGTHLHPTHHMANRTTPREPRCGHQLVAVRAGEPFRQWGFEVARDGCAVVLPVCHRWLEGEWREEESD